MFAPQAVKNQHIKFSICKRSAAIELQLLHSGEPFFSQLFRAYASKVCVVVFVPLLQPSTIVMDFSFCTQQMNNWKSHYIFMWSILQIIVFESASILITASSAHSLGTFKSSKFIHSQRWTNTFSIGWNLTTFYYIKCARSAWKKTMTPSVLFVSLALSFLLTRIHHCMFYSYCVHIGDIFIHLLSHLGRYFRLLALQYLHTI